MSRDERYGRLYRFGPIERSGLVGAMRLSQLLVLGMGAVMAIGAFRAAPGGRGLLLGVLVVTAAALACFLPVRGRTLDEWAPLVLGWIWMRASGDDRYLSRQPTGGLIATLDGSNTRRDLDLPDALRGCSILPVPVAEGHEIGVFRDPALGALTAVLTVRIRAFGLLGELEQERRLARWGEVLAGLAQAGTSLRRLAVLERSVPSDGDELQRYLAEARDRQVMPSDPARRSYEELLESAGAVTQDHELFLALQVDERRASARGARVHRERQSDPLRLACAVLSREVHAVASRFDPTDVVVEGALSPRMLARAIRLAFDPYRREQLNRLAAAAPEMEGADPGAFGATATELAWGSYRTDGAVHRTYWVAQWPRLAVGPTFLTPLLLEAETVRSVAIVFEPVAPARARREVEAAITNDEAQEQLRDERGFRTTARQQRRRQATLQRERELADGHQEVRFAAFVTVTARDEHELEFACERVEQAGQQAHLDLEPMWGQQDVAFAQGALPIARGLRSNGLLGGGRW